MRNLPKNLLVVISPAVVVANWNRGDFRLKLSPVSKRCLWWLIFFKNLFYQKICKKTMKIGESQIRGALFNFFVVKKCPFLHLPDAALSFYNNHCATIQNFNFPYVSIKKQPSNLFSIKYSCCHQQNRKIWEKIIFINASMNACQIGCKCSSCLKFRTGI